MGTFRVCYTQTVKYRVKKGAESNGAPLFPGEPVDRDIGSEMVKNHRVI